MNDDQSIESESSGKARKRKSPHDYQMDDEKKNELESGEDVSFTEDKTTRLSRLWKRRRAPLERQERGFSRAVKMIGNRVLRKICCY